MIDPLSDLAYIERRDRERSQSLRREAAKRQFNLYHVHEWKVAGELKEGAFVLVCPHHDPPWTREVR